MFMKIEDGQPVWPIININRLRQLFPNVSLPDQPRLDDLQTLGYAPYEQTSPPEYRMFEDQIEGMPELDEDGWVRSKWTAVTQDMELVKTQLRRWTTDKRWVVETGGVTVNGAVVKTSIEDQNRITSVRVNARAAGLTTIHFKAVTAEGETQWVVLDMDQVDAVANAVALHVQGAYTAEKAHYDQVDALTNVEDARTYYEQGLQQGWPTDAGMSDTAPDGRMSLPQG